MSDVIDWEVVNRHLKCGICGEPAFISPESDGYEGVHTHRFPVSRAQALAITKEFGRPTYEELEAEVERLRNRLESGE